MRSIINASAIAALALSLAAGGAFAAEGHSGRGTATGPENGDYYQGVVPNDGAFSPPASALRIAAATPAVQKPRLQNILDELRSANRRLDKDRSEGKLSAAAFNRLQREAAGIRTDAMKVAEEHYGAIPRGSYAQFERDIRQLDRNIRSA